MASILWACWDGGGNLPPSLGIAAELRERGHAVHFHGRPEMVERARAAGQPASALAEARTDLPRYAFHPLPTVFGFTSSPAVGEELVGLVAQHRPDLVVIDAMFTAALEAAPRFGVPTVVVVHTFFDRLFDGWCANLAMQSQTRQQAGFAALPGPDTLWGRRDVLHVNTLAAFDGPTATSWGNVRHGGPVLAGDGRAVPVELPWPAHDPTPLVLLSFSTVPEQRNPESLQRALDALAELPVHVVSTTAGLVDPTDLEVPANAHLVRFADHDQLLGRAHVVLGHGGHGTTMRALRAGVPLVVTPARGADQPGVARFVEEAGLGRGLPGDASADVIRRAVGQVLDDPAFAAAARIAAGRFDGVDAAGLAADSVELALAPGPVTVR